MEEEESKVGARREYEDRGGVADQQASHERVARDCGRVESQPEGGEGLREKLLL